MGVFLFFERHIGEAAMTEAIQEYASFLVRIYRPGIGRGQTCEELQCEIEHIQSGRIWRVGSLPALVEFWSTRLENAAWLAINDAD